MRSFIMKKKNVNPPKPVGPLSFKSEDQVLELKVQQKIFKTFQIDHSLSLLKNLSQRTRHLRYTAHNAVAPTPVSDIINAITASSSGCSENSESGSIIDETVPVLRQEVIEETFPTEAAEDMAHFAAVTALDVNGGRVATRLINDYIYELYKPTEEPVIEIILFHGLGLHDSVNLHLSTWISGDVGEQHVWPKTWLADDFPLARVLTVSFDSSVYKTAEEGRIDLHNAAESLMICLLLQEEKPSFRSFGPGCAYKHQFSSLREARTRTIVALKCNLDVEGYWELVSNVTPCPAAPTQAELTAAATAVANAVVGAAIPAVQVSVDIKNTAIETWLKRDKIARAPIWDCYTKEIHDVELNITQMQSERADEPERERVTK
ncbi:hypothetical protein R1flu_003436 [Riccia fluitans]|uniref:Uncharacterized protein n=1 Tax=Riccia fluitans TaxID=41844 RepID=A0ABD1Y919_9MARC